MKIFFSVVYILTFTLAWGVLVLDWGGFDSFHMGKTGSSSGVPFLQRTPLSSSHRTSRLKHTKQRKGGEDVTVFLEALVREGVLTLLACLRRTHGSLWRAWWSSRGTWRQPPPREVFFRTPRWRSCLSSLRGRRRGPVQFPPDRRPAKPLADACCCASMQRSGQRIEPVKLLPLKRVWGLYFHFIYLWLPLTSLSWKGGDGKGNN